jgi:hypothetical protein
MRFGEYLLLEQKYKLIDFNEKKPEEIEDSKKESKKSKVIDLTKDRDTTEPDNDESTGDDESNEHPHEQDEDKQESKEDPDKQGLIRTIKGAHLIYKRQESDGTYGELWIYKIDKGMKDEYKIRNAILNGTDIDQKSGQSSDEKQHYELWTSNNRQLMKIYGLVN